LSTYTATATATNTVEATVTETYTDDTGVQTVTNTITEIETVTFTNTVTETVMNADTQTITDTATFEETDTMTFTEEIIETATDTVTSIDTVTDTETTTYTQETATINITETIDDEGDLEQSIYVDSLEDEIDLGDLLSNANIGNVQTLELATNETMTIDLEDILDITDNDHELVFVGADGNEIDFNNKEQWSKSEETTTIDGEEGNFYEYVNQQNPNISIFIDDDIDTNL
jgi:hypothetical protein